jgi:hypothetical protein
MLLARLGSAREQGGIVRSDLDLRDLGLPELAVVR